MASEANMMYALTDEGRIFCLNMDYGSIDWVEMPLPDEMRE